MNRLTVNIERAANGLLVFSCGATVLSAKAEDIVMESMTGGDYRVLLVRGVGHSGAPLTLRWLTGPVERFRVRVLSGRPLRMWAYPGETVDVQADVWVMPKAVLNVWLDDLRLMPGKDFDVHAAHSSACLDILGRFPVGRMSMDHDLGGDDKGAFVAVFLEEKAYLGGERLVFETSIHSANPVGAKDMRTALANMERYLSEAVV